MTAGPRAEDCPTCHGADANCAWRYAAEAAAGPRAIPQHSPACAGQDDNADCICGVSEAYALGLQDDAAGPRDEALLREAADYIEAYSIGRPRQQDLVARLREAAAGPMDMSPEGADGWLQCLYCGGIDSHKDDCPAPMTPWRRREAEAAAGDCVCGAREHRGECHFGWHKDGCPEAAAGPCPCGDPADTHYTTYGCLRCERYGRSHDYDPPERKDP
jgi:hypothetical protein